PAASPGTERPLTPPVLTESSQSQAPERIYVGDVNSVKVIDTATQKVTKNIPVSANGFRADEGCYDP
ncbi:MAG TPA: hypothetical protein DCR15_15735, partial [Arthrobacter bacterium]|nr:hypothetical protein [Arthrobacter sp.]